MHFDYTLTPKQLLTGLTGIIKKSQTICFMWYHSPISGGVENIC